MDAVDIYTIFSLKIKIKDQIPILLFFIKKYNIIQIKDKCNKKRNEQTNNQLNYF